ncbi:MAG: substrate-binding domain-containing protein, partial [Oceanipulchritudo sp.]
PTLLVILGIDYTYGRALLSGILKAVRKIPGLRIRLVRSEKELGQTLRTGQAFLAAAGMIWDKRQVSRLRKRAGLIISFANRPPYPADRHIILNDRAIGRMAAEEFSQLGLERLGFVGTDVHYHIRERSKGYADAASGMGFPADRFTDPRAGLDWVRRNEGPCGILAENDVHARQFLGLCEEAGLRVPMRVSVMGVDDDEVYVHLGTLSLSSIRLPFERMGELAVEAAVAGKSWKQPELIELPPTGVVHRDTTALMASQPPVVRRFMEFLKRERPLPSSVLDACRRTGLQRRTLELSSRKWLGSSPGDLLRAERLRLAGQLEREGRSRREIVMELGYSHPRSLAGLLQHPQARGRH